MMGSPDSEAELREIMDSIHLERGMAAEPLFKRNYRLPIFLAVTIGMFNQLSGINAILYYSNFIFAAAGFSLTTAFSTLNSLVQEHAPNELRGRVLSIFGLAFRGGGPMGSLAAGGLVRAFGAPTVLVDPAGGPGRTVRRSGPTATAPAGGAGGSRTSRG